MRRLPLAMLLLLSTACARNTWRKDGPAVLLAPAELARQSGLRPWAISMPFGKGQDGTLLVLDFLNRAEASGARFVSDLQVVFVAEEEGQPLECRTRLMPEGTAKDLQRGIRTAKAGPALPGLKLVQRLHTVPAFTCTPTTTRVAVSQTYYDAVPTPQQRTRSVLRTEQGVPQCGYVNVTKLLTRYAFEDAVHYLPPVIQRIRDVRPELKLEEAPAECVPRDPAAPAINRIEALAYGGAGPDAALGSTREVQPVRLDL